MIKEILLFALAAVCLSEASKSETYTADADFLFKQKKIYELLLNKYFDYYGSETYEVVRNYDIEANIDMYTNKEVVHEFWQRYRYGMLDLGAPYSFFYPEHLEETQALFDLFFYAKNFESFYKTALWAYYNMNKGTFFVAFSLAVFHRPDTKYIRLPPLYEITPNFFFDSQVIQYAEDFKMQRDTGKSPASSQDFYLIYANYSGSYLNHVGDTDYKLDYFIEDIGLNSYYYYFRQTYPYWMSSKEYFKDYKYVEQFRGSVYYYVHKFLLTRYYMERLSNDLEPFEYFDFDYEKTYVPGFHSKLEYDNGVQLPQRESTTYIPIYKQKYFSEIEDYEDRILAAIDSGYIIDYEGKKFSIYSREGWYLIANIIEGNADSYNSRFYGIIENLARNVYGFSPESVDKYKVFPSALQFYSTSMRDPAFYRLYQVIIRYFERYWNHMPPYSYEELYFPGVKIESVSVDKLMTYFDSFDSLINNAVSVKDLSDGNSFQIKARQYRLNHKPFSYHFTLSSDKTTKAMIRIFLGPAYDSYHREIDFSKSYWYFYEVDQFIVNLAPGTNTIQRHSSENTHVTADEISSEEYYKRLLKSIGGGAPFVYSKKVYGFPDRLILPKGKPEGMTYKLFFFVSPFDESKAYNFEVPILGPYYSDQHALGYPLNRPLYSWNFTMPNMYFKDVNIYHETKYDEKVFKNWKGTVAYGVGL